MSAIKTFLLLLALLCAFHPSPLCEAAVYYVKPTEPHNATCPSEPCRTLDEYVSNSTRYFVSNTVFMFVTGYHKLSYNLTVSDVLNITLRPYIEKSSVIINSEHMLLFELSSDIVIRDMTFQNLGIEFDNSTTVTLSGLRAENVSILLNNVFGEVNISHLKSNIRDYVHKALVMMWTVTQPQYVPITVVLLHNLDLELITGEIGVYISGCIPGKIILLNSTVNAFYGIYMGLGPLCNEMLFVCENTHFYYNNGLVGLYIGVIETSLHQDQHIMAVVLHNVSFIGYYYAVALDNVQNVTISNSYFGSISGGAVTVSNCVLTLKGNVTFRDNYSDNNGIGGAISLDGDSLILIPDPQNTYILFENNTSYDTGGAIYFMGSYTGYCKIFVERYSSKIVFNFSMNTAANGGNAIYGAYLNLSCYSPNGAFVKNISQLILNVSSFTPSLSDDLSVISSDVQNLCFCDKDEKLGNCDGPSYPNLPSVYPGQVFRLSVAALGDMNGLVKWPVYASVYLGKFGNEIQHSQNTNSERCTYFKYSVLSTENSATLEFSLRSSPSSRFVSDANYTVRLLDCPLGFSLSNDSGCECQEYLLRNIENLACNITEHSIQRQGTTWIGVVENSTGSITLENTTALAFSNVCPFHYCNISKVKILVNQTSFLNKDIQCTDNRSGVLCGGCRDSFSLALGSNRCLHGCSNNSLSLLIAFAAAGIALVFFIKILNLTVSQGTINGLVFYANIVGAEQTVLFSSKGFLSVFIAWVNLDLGFETCFFDGMDAYTKAWLQFVFPVYVWVIALFIIILSHYSIRASKLFGNNSVPVLATLILLSYSKLLRAVISALSITRIQFLNGFTMSVWERDGNIQYLTGKHIPLFVFAVAVLVLLWFPFTLILASIQWLQRGTHYRVLRWVTRLRPFFEAFTGPLKDKHRYWVGALLLARCSQLFVFYIYTANGSGVAFVTINFAILIILVFLAVTGFVYRNYFPSVLELSYIFNLGILSTGTLYVRYIDNSGNQEALVIFSVSIAFLQFIATVIYHAYVQLREPLKKLKIRKAGQEDIGNINEPKQENYESLDETVQQPPLKEFSKFRESLLGYIDD